MWCLLHLESYQVSLVTLVMCIFSLFFFLSVLLEVCSSYWSFKESAVCFIDFLRWFSVSNSNHVCVFWCLTSGVPPPCRQARLELGHGNREGVGGGNCFHPSVWRAVNGRVGDVAGNSRCRGEGIPADPACLLCFWLHVAWGVSRRWWGQTQVHWGTQLT